MHKIARVCCTFYSVPDSGRNTPAKLSKVKAAGCVAIDASASTADARVMGSRPSLSLHASLLVLRPRPSCWPLPVAHRSHECVCKEKLVHVIIRAEVTHQRALLRASGRASWHPALPYIYFSDTVSVLLHLLTLPVRTDLLLVAMARAVVFVQAPSSAVLLFSFFWLLFGDFEGTLTRRG